MDTRDSDESGKVVNLFEFRDRKLEEDCENMEDFFSGYSNEELLNLTEMLQALKDGTGEFDLPLDLPPSEWAKLQAILCCVDDVLVNLFSCQAVIKSDELWKRTTEIRKHLIAMSEFVEENR
jgi:hypothetical protein